MRRRCVADSRHSRHCRREMSLVKRDREGTSPNSLRVGITWSAMTTIKNSTACADYFDVDHAVRWCLNESRADSQGGKTEEIPLGSRGTVRGVATVARENRRNPAVSSVVQLVFHSLRV